MKTGLLKKPSVKKAEPFLTNSHKVDIQSVFG